LQRAYDPIIHDVAIQKLPVLFCLDRAGLSPNDGATHHGLFDLSYLRPIPNCVIMAPSNEDELADMIQTGLNYSGPAFVRYPRGTGTGISVKAKPESLSIGQGKRHKKAVDIDIWALGSLFELGEKLVVRLSEHDITAGLFDPRFVKPLDESALKASAKSVSLIVTLEDNVLKGGFGSAVLEALDECHSDCPVERIGWSDTFVEHGSSVKALRDAQSLDLESILSKILEAVKRLDCQNASSIS
ncbi:MAG: 1-deoxy-D-xylulose-5-phosphate synthase, partial [Puniceicoccaceae bacterium]